MRTPLALLAGVLASGVLAGIGAGSALDVARSSASNTHVTASPAISAATTTPTTAVNPRPEGIDPDPDPTALDSVPSHAAPPPLDPTKALTWAERLSARGPVLPSDCPFPHGNASRLPNASRSYREGIHEGVDFFCPRRGGTAMSALPGRIVIATHGYVEPVEADRAALLDTAHRLGWTPRWLLTLLWGRHVIIDHGVIPDVGYVMSVYAHLDTIEPSLHPGVSIQRGQPIGTIGDSGTSGASRKTTDDSLVHLHWELHVDDRYLGVGLDEAATATVYRTLFGLLEPTPATSPPTPSRQ